MSLYKQLWLAILFLMALAFVGSFVVSSMSAKDYLEQQLGLKNIDNANSLALAIANTASDEVTTKLMVSAQFDTGHYQYIRLTDIKGNIIAENVDQVTSATTPDWFTQLLEINAQEGISQVQRGWQQVGTLTLKSHDIFAYQALWDSSVRLFSYCIGIALISGLLGTILLKIILRPLTATVAQADAISKRQFVIVDEPSTKEFKEVARSMNSLSRHIKKVMEDESARLFRLQKDVLFDEVTGLPNREHFLNILGANLESEDSHSVGVLVIIRLQNLADLNRAHGRQFMDLLLSRIGKVFDEHSRDQAGWKVGRLNGSDFAILAQGHQEPQLIAHSMQELVLSTIEETAAPFKPDLPTAASIYHWGEDLSLLLSKVDAALASAEQRGDSAVETADDKALASPKIDVEQWKQLLDESFVHSHFSLAKFPVIDAQNALLHSECPARLSTKQGDVMNGGQFMPWVNRFDLGLKLDEQIVDLALHELATSNVNLCINLSAQALNSGEFLLQLKNKLSKQIGTAERLWMEVPEHSVYQNLSGFKNFCHTIKPLGCRIGIEHVGHQISQIGQIHDLGLDYIKIDASLTRKVQNTPAHQVLLRGLCMIVHSVGLIAIAEGVQEQAQWDMLKELGVDGGTGPMVTLTINNTR
jgi:EAL domain-containing protein (putative c-di-GMP-specific phosphodiesterase class I)/GGDEF domain-containing protein